FQPVFSAPAPACLTTNAFTLRVEPRSTVNVLVPAASEHHLLLLTIMPSTAIAAASAGAHDAEAVTALPWARFVPRSGAAGGWLPPSVNDGGTSPAPVPQLLPALAPIW